MIRTRYHGETSYKLIIGINHNIELRIQLCLILKYLGLPRDLRQLLIRKVWFDCQSEVLRQERLIWFPMRPKFVIPILEMVEICYGQLGGRVGYYPPKQKWKRLYSINIEDVMKDLYISNFPSILTLRKRKKLKI